MRLGCTPVRSVHLTDSGSQQVLLGEKEPLAFHIEGKALNTTSFKRALSQPQKGLGAPISDSLYSKARSQAQ